MRSEVAYEQENILTGFLPNITVCLSKCSHDDRGELPVRILLKRLDLGFKHFSHVLESLLSDLDLRLQQVHVKSIESRIHASIVGRVKVAQNFSTVHGELLQCPGHNFCE